MNRRVVGNVVAIVLQGRRIERKKPYRRDAEILKVVEFGGESCKIADPVVVTVVKRADVQLVNDRVLVPERIVLEREPFSECTHGVCASPSVKSALVRFLFHSTLKMCAGVSSGRNST